MTPCGAQSAAPPPQARPVPSSGKGPIQELRDLVRVGDAGIPREQHAGSQSVCHAAGQEACVWTKNVFFQPFTALFVEIVFQGWVLSLPGMRKRTQRLRIQTDTEVRLQLLDRSLSCFET
eukprot:CAMPEP_0197920722 /NCGR_PEP_ID=MMETSP1439-20131203/89464_1 /TAXON_ID=66791 /ORGANISM="Gonyaulax spinifera, Strain CCMP409" /LENGTH=119 /DNA_ID=CAMNT_0043542937 /DNA_START=23 /DNA_END=383 /DNA_ORIENTATION=-